MKIINKIKTCGVKFNRNQSYRISQNQKVKGILSVNNKIIYITLLLVIPFLSKAQSTNENHIVTKVYKKATKNSISGHNKDQVMTNIQYFDGLGRLKQSVAVNGGGNAISNNNVPIDWTLNNTGSTDFFNRNGTDTENKIVSGTTPFNVTDLLWQCIPDAASGPDGGWNTDYFKVDNTKSYRYSIWVKRTGSQAGTTYHGTQEVNNLNGTPNTNPYFWAGDLPQLNTWYLMVGVVHPHSYTGGDTGVSGVYDMNGNKVLDGTEFKWRTNDNATRLRNYLYYCTDTNVRQYFWNPLFEEVDGNELPLEDIINNATTVNSQSIIKDVVTHVEYDRLGRMPKEYLPVTNGSGNASFRNGMDMVSKEYYARKYAKDFDGVNLLSDINPYSEKDFNDSPLNRIEKQAAPGTDWKLGNGHEIKFSYNSNGVNEIKKFTVKTTLNNNTYMPSLEGGISYYPAGTLYKTVTKDENWKEGQVYTKDHTTEEFKNKSGEVILKRTYNRNQKHDTYYVYDIFGNLTYVIPPKMEGTTSSLSSIKSNLNDLGYQYKYDYRNRLVEKRIPGRNDWDLIVYDNLDRPVLTQDPNLKAKNQWLVTKYDKLGRIAYTGIFTSTSNTFRVDLQNIFSAKNNEESNYETKVSGYTLGGAFIYYSNNNFPTNITEVLTIQYYDNYLVNRETSPISVSSYGKTSELEVKGLPTVSKVKVLGTCCTLITSINYYDTKGRVFHNYTRNPYLGTTDIVESKLDDFTGKVLETKSTHKKTGKADLITIDRFEYDHMDRLVSQNQQINNQISERIVKNNYDDLGQLESKIVGNGTQAGYKDVTPGIVVNNNIISKAGAQGWSHGLATQGSFNGDGYVEFSPKIQGKYFMAGLSSNNTNAHYGSINYAIYIVHTSNVYVYESYTNKGLQTTYNAGDVFRVERIGNTIHYKKNGETFYISKTKSTGSLLGDISMYHTGAEIQDLKIVDNSKGLQKVDYKYNVRGWLTNINDDLHVDNDLFNFSIKYNDPSLDLNKRLYNGNIAQTSWQTQNIDISRKTYNYTYDALNRLTAAIMPTTSNYNLDEVAYDKNGNITFLSRNGHTNALANNFDTLDELMYSYDNGNKLKSVADVSGNTFGFKDGASATTEYFYDANGNMTKDLNKRIINITYNHLNLPTLVEFGPDKNGLGEGEIEYIYSATGEKLKKHSTIAEGDFPPYEDQEKFTEYAGNYIYEGEYGSIDLQFFNHPEGYVKYGLKSSSSGKKGLLPSFEYVYQYKDHLGNIRLSYTDVDGDGTIQAVGRDTEIVEEKNYYPFGLEHKGYNNTSYGTGNATAEKFGYNGKELNEELGLQWHDFGARNYDAALGRWMNLDPLAEEMRRHSPYNYAFNNPIYFIDPDGMAPKTQDDIYLDAKTGKFLGEDGAITNNVRVIHKSDFNDISSENSGTKSLKATAQLQSRSSIVTINEDKIAKDIANVNNETVNDQTKERQTYIVLKTDPYQDIPTAEVTSIRGKDGVDGETTLTVDTKRDGTQTVKGGKNILLGQVHSHNLNTTPGFVNSPETSTKDRNTSSSLNIPVYAIDSYTGQPSINLPAGSTGPQMHKVFNGIKYNNIGNTANQQVGKDALKTFIK